MVPKLATLNDTTLENTTKPNTHLDLRFATNLSWYFATPNSFLDPLGSYRQGFFNE
jgi:hypothetical protein